MSGRADPLAILKDPTTFSTKPKNQRPVEEAVIDTISKENNFLSRQAPKAPSAPRRKVRRFRTGRNQQVNIKATGDTIERFLKAADDRSVPLGELLRLALDALERAGVPN